MAFYDNFIKSEYAETTKIGRFALEKINTNLINQIKKIKNNSIKLLEIGPGKGFFAETCFKNKINYTAIEANTLMATILTKKGFRVYNYLVPPIKIREKFDVIFMNQVFEHIINRTEAMKLIKNCNEHLNRTGLLIICSPDYLSWKEDFFASDYTHNNPTSSRNIQQILQDNDFKILYTELICSIAQGFIITKLVTAFVRFTYNLGLFNIIFGGKAYKIKTSLLPSILVIGEKNE